MLHSRMLKYLDEVARLGSIRKAAARLNVASSAINRQILALENELGAPIFERMPRRLRLTATGEVLISHVRDTLKGHQRVEAHIEALKGLTRGEVTIATMNGLGGGAAAAISQQHPGHPSARARPLARAAARPDGQRRADRRGRSGAVLSTPAESRACASSQSHDLMLGAVVSAKHPLTARRAVRLADCAEFPLAIADHSMTIRPAVELAFTRANVPLYPTIETNSIEFMKKIAASGQAITFLNAVDVDEEVQAGEIRHLQLPELYEPSDLAAADGACPRRTRTVSRALWSRNCARRCPSSSRSAMPDRQRSERKTALARHGACGLLHEVCQQRRSSLAPGSGRFSCRDKLRCHAKSDASKGSTPRRPS